MILFYSISSVCFRSFDERKAEEAWEGDCLKSGLLYSPHALTRDTHPEWPSMKTLRTKNPP